MVVQAAPGMTAETSSEYEAPIIGPLAPLPSEEEINPLIGRPVCVALFS